MTDTIKEDQETPVEKPSDVVAELPSSDLLAEIDFIWRVLRDAERGLNRLGVYAKVELGGVCYEVQKAQQHMKDGNFQKARDLLQSFSR